jgi:hypothetical protein
MRISPEHIEKYKQIYRKEYKSEISNELAYEELSALVTLMGAVNRHQNKNAQA